MSKLIDSLRRISQANSSPIGFRSASLPRPAPMLLLGHLTQVNGETLDSIANSGLDALILGTGKQQHFEAKPLSGLAQAASQIPWGVLVGGEMAENGVALVEAGADFVVADLATGPAAILQEKRLGRLLAIDSSLPDNMVRAVDALAVEAVLLYTGFEGASHLTVNHLLICQRVASLLRKPLLATVSPLLSVADFQALAGTGIKGVVVKVPDKDVVAKLSALKHTLETLSVPRQREREVTLPQLNPDPAQTEDRELL